MRLFDAEMSVRLEQRKRYFENPSYRKWSDIVPNCIYRNYEGLPDDDFFIQYLFGDSENTSYSPQDICDKLSEGYELPIDWNAFYDYFDERFNDPENGYKHQLTGGYYTAGCNDDVGIMELLDEYRDILLNQTYDIV